MIINVCGTVRANRSDAGIRSCPCSTRCWRTGWRLAERHLVHFSTDGCPALNAATDMVSQHSSSQHKMRSGTLEAACRRARWFTQTGERIKKKMLAARTIVKVKLYPLAHHLSQSPFGLLMTGILLSGAQSLPPGLQVITEAVVIVKAMTCCCFLGHRPFSCTLDFHLLTSPPSFLKSPCILFSFSCFLVLISCF